MNARAIRTAVFALAAAASVTAFAQAPADNGQKTRQQVLAELAEAQRHGDMQAAGEFAQTAREQHATSSLTREQVRAEVLRASRHGTLLAAGEQATDTAAPAALALAVAGKTRAQVKAELAEAQRNGELLVAGETGLQQRDVARANTAPAATAPAVASR